MLNDLNQLGPKDPGALSRYCYDGASISQAYRTALLKTHPDKAAPRDKARATEVFKHLRTAYERFCDKHGKPARRRQPPAQRAPLAQARDGAPANTDVDMGMD
jgi:hypothetical protein